MFGRDFSNFIYENCFVSNGTVTQTIICIEDLLKMIAISIVIDSIGRSFRAKISVWDVDIDGFQ